MNRERDIARRGRARRAWRDLRWPAVGLAFAAVTLLGAIGWVRYLDALHAQWSLLDVTYRSLQLFVLEGGAVDRAVPWELQVARFAAPMVLGYTAVSTLAIVLRDQIERWRIRRLRGHVVVCGLGRRGLLLVRSLRAQGRPVVAVELDADNDLLDSVRAVGALVLVGDATDPETLHAVQAPRATHVIAVTESDGTNADIALHAGHLAADRPGRHLACLAHIGDPELSAPLRARELETTARRGFTLDFFDVYQRGAAILLHRLARLPTGGERPPHLVVVGLGRLGAAVVMRGARDRHRDAPGAPPMRVTVVDRDADERVAALMARHPRIREVCELAPVAVGTESAAFLAGAFLLDAAGGCDIDAAFVCIDDDPVAVPAALALHRLLGPRGIPVIVRMQREAGLALLLEGSADGAEPVQAFPLLEETCTAELVLGGTYAQVARAIHEHYLAARGPAGESSDTPARVPWEHLAEPFRESNRAQAYALGATLRELRYGISPLDDWGAESFRFPDHELECLAEREHERFLDERRDAGWTYAPGPPDPVARTSPWLVAWADLPDDIRDRDRDAVRAIPTVLAAAGFQLVRLAARSDAGTRNPGDDHPDRS